MFEQRTIIDQIEIRRDGTVQVRLDKQLVKDGKVVGSGWHRCVFEPGADVDAVADAVNAHLTEMGETPVEASEWGRVKRVAVIEHSEDVVMAHRQKKAEEMQKILLDAENTKAKQSR